MFPVKTVSSVCKLVDMQQLDKRQYSIEDCGEQISYQRYLSSNVSNSSIQLTCLPPSDSTLIDPKIFANVEYLIDFVGSGTGPLLGIGTTDAPGEHPFSNSCTVASATINGGTISTNLQQWFPALSRFCVDYHQQDRELSTTASMLDNCQQYADVFGTNKNPLGAYGDNTQQIPRGAFAGIEVVSNTNTTAQVRLKVSEPIMIPGLYYNKYALANVRNLNFLFTFGNLINSIWSHDAVNGNLITSAVANISSFSLDFRFITQKVLNKLPRSLVYNYHELVPTNTNFNSVVAAGATFSISMNAINNMAIPRGYYVYICKDPALRTYNEARSFFRINNITLNFMNRVGVLSSCSIDNTYRYCVENGYQYNFNTWSKESGSVIFIDVNRQIGLSSLLACGLLQPSQISMTVNATNINSVGIQPILFVQTVYEGCMNIGADGSFSKSNAVLSNQDVLQSQLADAPKVSAKDEPSNYYGGSLLSDVIETGKNVVNLVDSASRVLKNIPGMGMSVGGSLVGGRRRKKGGQMIDREEIADHMYEYEN